MDLLDLGIKVVGSLFTGGLDYLQMKDLKKLPQEEKNAALCGSAARGDPGLMEQLLKAGAHVDSRHENGITALMFASYNGFWDRGAKLLCEQGTDINAKDNNGMSALSCASGGKEDNYEVVQHLLVRGANPNVVDNAGMTPLAYATMVGHFRVVKKLLHGGATPAHKIPSGQSLTQLASVHPYKSIEKTLIRAQKPLVKQMTEAYRNGDHARVSTLLSKGVNPNIKVSSFRRSILAEAASRGDSETVKLLIEHGATVTKEVLRAQKPLVKQMTEAYRNRNHARVSTLLDKGVNPNVKVSLFRWSILTEAAHRGDLETLKLLINCGATVTKEAIRVARSRGHTEAADYLEFDC